MRRVKTAKELAEEIWRVYKKGKGVPRCAFCGRPIKRKEEAFLGRKG